MRHRTRKFRRVTAAAVLGLGMTAGVIGVTAGAAGAASTSATLTASNVKQVPANTSTSPYAATGTLKLTINAAGTTVAGVLKFTLPAGADWESGTPAIAASPTPGTATITASTFTSGTTKATITLSTGSVTSGEVINVTGIHIKTVNLAPGHVTVTPAATTSTGLTALAPTGTVEIAYVGASTNSANSITASSKPTIASTGNNQTAGNLTVKLTGTSATATTPTHLKLTAAATGGTVKFSSVTVSSSGITATTTFTSATPSATMTITLGTLAATHTATVTVSGIKYNTSGAQGTITVTPKWGKTATAAGTTEGTFTPSKAVNAVSSAGVPAGAATIKVTAASVPTIGVGMTGTAGNETVVITGSTSTNKAGWTAGGSLTLKVSLTGTCNATTKFLAFSGTPTVTYTATTSSGASTTPKVKATLASVSPCTTAGKDNELKITFTNTVTLSKTGSTAGKATFIISGIKYAAGATDVHGAATVTTATSSTFDATHPIPTGSPTNADIAYAYVTTTPVSVTPGSYDHATTPVKVIEAKGHTVPTGYVCLTLSTGTFNTSASASVKATGGGTAGSTVSYKSTDKTAMFDVTKQSTATKPSTFTVSGLAVNASATATHKSNVTARDGETATCAKLGNTTTLLTTAVAHTASPNMQLLLSTLASSTQIGGQTAAATAVKLLETSFTASAATKCPGTGTTGNNNRPVVLATETHFQDALSSQYLASYLKTGVLLTTYGSIPAVTIQALKTEGITQVDIVGGPLAVSTAVKTQLETLPAYTCGGTNELKTNGHVRFLSVTRIYGYTAMGTAQAIDSLVPSSHVASYKFVTAYLGVNAKKGTGMYNTTGGLSSAPTTSGAVPTAILASGAEFQDAMAASALSYWRKATHGLPIVLTSPTSLTSNAAGALVTTGAKQVILMGGTLAVTNSVVTTLVSDGIEVLRIAGQNYTGTAAELAKFEHGTATTKGVGWGSVLKQVAVARGNGFTDGLVGGVVAGSTTATTRTGNTVPESLVLTLSPTAVGATLTAFLKAYGQSGNGDIKTLQIFGGSLAVSPAVVNQMESDIS